MDTITTDDDMRLLLSDCEIGLMQDDLQFREDDPSEFSVLFAIFGHNENYMLMANTKVDMPYSLPKGDALPKGLPPAEAPNCQT
ncbi:unnamed protein product [Prunus armeniaca]